MDGKISNKLRKVLEDPKARKQFRIALTGGPNRIELDGRVYRVAGMRDKNNNTERSFIDRHAILSILRDGKKTIYTEDNIMYSLATPDSNNKIYVSKWELNCELNAINGEDWYYYYTDNIVSAMRLLPTEKGVHWSTEYQYWNEGKEYLAKIVRHGNRNSPEQVIKYRHRELCVAICAAVFYYDTGVEVVLD